MSFIGGAATSFLKKEDKFFWSLALIVFVNLALGVLFVISMNISIGLILSVILLAMMINKYLKVRGQTDKRVN